MGDSGVVKGLTRRGAGHRSGPASIVAEKEYPEFMGAVTDSCPPPLDPEIAGYLASLPPGTFDFDEWTLETIAARRAARAALPVPAAPPTTTVFRDEQVDAAVQARIYSPPSPPAPPDAGPPRPCVYWIHGGGYISGSALTVDPRLSRWVEDLGCVAVAVEYRLAPEHPYPGPLEDCYAGLSWTITHAERLGVDPARIVLAGSSAGAGLAAALALLARDRGGPSLAHQVLIYPMLDDRQTTRSSQMDGTAVWGRAANALGWRAYLGPDAGRADVPAYAASARAVDLAGLRRRSSRSGAPTCSGTRASRTPPASSRPGYRPSFTSTRARRTASRSSPRRRTCRAAATPRSPALSGARSTRRSPRSTGRA